ncbi:MAG: hypothetical protein LBJ84_02735 [Oscillospiraceae bacterium]|jgi:hypothetical protein|nr:hypothetical protein [Oscillospiraceae bacterium]
MKNIGKKLVCACFLAAISILGILFFVVEKQTFSDDENRLLAEPPKLSEGNAINTRFYYDMQKYYSDAFPFRTQFLAVNRGMQSVYALGRFGSDDGVTFVVIDNTQRDKPTAADETPEQSADEAPVPAEEPIDVSMSSMPIVGDRAFELFIYDERRTETYAALVNELAALCGVPAYVVLPPSASELYLPEKYRTAENEQRQAFDKLEELLTEAALVDAYGAFAQSKDGYIYFRTDHHWTADGAYLAYRAFCEAADIPFAEKSSMPSGQLDGFLGSLYKAAAQNPNNERLRANPDFLRYYMPAYATEIYNYQSAKLRNGERRELIYPEYGQTSNLYNVFFGGDMQLMHMKSEVNNGKSIMVVRDSYGHAFLPYLANNYENVYAIEPRYFNSFDLAEFVSANNIDELLFVGHSLPSTGGYWLNWNAELEKLK